MVYLAPVPTFYTIYKKKSTGEFQCFPYVITLFSSMLWVYYACLKSNALLLLIINFIGCFIEIGYIIMYLIYAPRTTKLITARTVAFLNIAMFGLILACTLLLSHGHQRTNILGWICAAFSACVFVAPLSIMRLVILTKSVEFMPFFLSFSLTINASIWLGYGVLSKDKFVALPNILGLVLGILQIALYCVYKDAKPKRTILPVSVTAVPTIVPVSYQRSEADNVEEDGEDRARI
ncbi:Bidirectional sugar transporter SWEET14 [Platanthera zijinensis]|uniref:Bidirectional sugar transporter SWEET n=1 Tax=Platanthera zijinensis TaxID=2320716 RepID=A0AAP0GA70_9ASPA